MAENKKENENAPLEETAKAVVYELGYHIPSAVGEENVPSSVSKVKGVLEKHGAVFIAEEFPALMQLVYPIVIRHAGAHESFNSAYFGWVKFEMNPTELTKVEEELKLESELIRFLLIKTVREDTRVPKRLLLQKTEGGRESAPSIIKHTPKQTAEEKPEKPMTDDELDKAVEELVGEEK